RSLTSLRICKSSLSMVLRMALSCAADLAGGLLSDSGLRAMKRLAWGCCAGVALNLVMLPTVVNYRDRRVLQLVTRNEEMGYGGCRPSAARLGSKDGSRGDRGGGCE